MVNCTKTEICGLRNAEILLEKNMQKIYRKFTGIDEAREWGKKNYSYWLPRYQLGGRLKGNCKR